MENDRIFLLTQPQHLSQARQWDGIIAHHRYRIGSNFHLLRAVSPPVQGGLMVVCDYGYDGCSFQSHFVQEVLWECSRQKFSGVLFDFETSPPPLRQCVVHLDAVFSDYPYTLYITEPYVPCAPSGKVLISSAISGGTLTARITQAVEHFGTDRVVLALERSAEDFTIPAPSGCGTPLSSCHLENLLHQTGSSVFFSRELCTNYFTYLDRQEQAHFVLFDTTETLLRKMEIARRCKLRQFLLPWSEICSCPRSFGLSQRTNLTPQKNF